jgi:hypothetical protein
VTENLKVGELPVGHPEKVEAPIYHSKPITRTHAYSCAMTPVSTVFLD